MSLYILDTSAVISGFVPLDEPGSRYLTVNGVVAEVTNTEERLKLDLALDRGAIRVEEPGEESLSNVRAAAAKSGDLRNLSDTDMAILALALETKGTILTDDFDIQNVASIMDLEYTPMAERGIGRVFKWKLVCKGCRKAYPADYKEKTCEVCGSPLKNVPDRR